MTKRICIIDGQGGGIGQALIKYFRDTFGESVELIALGTNEIATAQMLKAGANRGASGDNAVCRTVRDADYIIGSIAVTWPNAMLGEVTPRMADAVMASTARKILLPLHLELVRIVGVSKEPLPHLVLEVVKHMKEELNHV